jgi:hypothetical protein
MSNGIKKIFENAIWWSGILMMGLVLGVSLQFVRTWKNPTVVSLANPSLSANVALAQGASGSGACYVSYSGKCSAKFTDRGTIGKWGQCSYWGGFTWIYTFLPAGGKCAPWDNDSYTFDEGEEHLCCL